MEDVLLSLFKISVIAFVVPLVLGLFPRLRVPAIALELVVGIIVGPQVLDWIEPTSFIRIMGTIGVAFLLFLAGLELDLEDLRGAPLRLSSISFIASFAIALVVTEILGAGRLIVSPLLVSIALSATSMGIIVPVLSDAGLLKATVGKFAIAGGTIAEFATIALLGVFFAGGGKSAGIETLLLLLVAVLAVGLLWLLRRFGRSSLVETLMERLDHTSAQTRIRGAVMVLMGAATLAAAFGFESILGTFLAGIVFAIVVKGAPYEESFRTRIEAIGFGFFVPIFFISSGMALDVKGVLTVDEGLRVGLFLLLLLLIRGVPAWVYRQHLNRGEIFAVGFLQASNLSFIVVATSVGLELGLMRHINASSLVIAGLISAVLFPGVAQALLKRSDHVTVLPQAEPDIEAL